MLWIPASAVAINPSGIKTLLANDLSTSFINSKLIFVNDIKRPPRNLSKWIVLETSVFDNSIIANEFFGNA